MVASGHRYFVKRATVNEQKTPPAPTIASQCQPMPFNSPNDLLLVSTTSFLTTTNLIYTRGAGITEAAGTRLSLHSLLVNGFSLYSLQLRNFIQIPHCYLLSLPPCIRIGQFAHLLPSLDVFAVSQADSPEPNSNSPYPSLPSQFSILTTR